jgi:arylsulfatase A-like enzyme
MSRRGSLVLLSLLASPALAADPPATPSLNVLFIAVDDWRPSGGAYGDPTTLTPNIDRLAARGVVFRRAYCQQAVCSPSRTSLLTGRRPDTTRVYDLETHFRTTIPDAVTLPQHFKAHGYHAEGMGKIYHGGLDDPASWSVPHWSPKAPGFGPEGQAVLRRLQSEADAQPKPKAAAKKKADNRVRGLPFEAPDVPDDALADGVLAAHAVERLAALKDRPFFLAVGFVKPHLPFVAPKRYWDRYDRDTLSLAKNPFPPAEAPAFAGSDWGELRAYVGIPKSGPLPDEQARSLIHGYRAATSFMDAQIGRLLDALDASGVADRTVIVLWGDHGWKLGEHGMWCKHTNYENDTNAPLLLAAPGRAKGRRADGLVEFVDIYPTLAELCRLPRPEGLEGASLVPLLDDPDRPGKAAVFSQYPRSIPGRGRAMGYAMRTDRYRLVSWKPLAGGDRVDELYDHQADPAENANLAGKPEHAAILEALRARLDAGPKAVAPPSSASPARRAG